MNSAASVSRICALLLLTSLHPAGTQAIEPPPGTTWPNPARILIVYNSAFTTDGDADGSQDSLQVAAYYASKRGVPAANMLGLPFSTTGSYSSYPQLETELMAPLRARLSELGRASIDVILFVYGTPISWADASGTHSVDNTVMAVTFWSAQNPPFWAPNGNADANAGSHPDRPRFIHGNLPTIFCTAACLTDMYMVARLDGPRGVSGALDLIDQALYADKYLTGLSSPGYFSGNGYVDSRASYTDAYLMSHPAVLYGDYTTYSAVDLNLASTEHSLLNSPFPLKWERSGATIGSNSTQTYQDGASAATGDRALFYAGWYNYSTYHDVWDWLPGSVVSEFASDSLAGLRTAKFPAGRGAFGVNALARGATCVSGAITEPYTVGHPMGDVLVHYMLAGYTWAEASMFAMPSIGWVGVSIGDPLYAPLRPKANVPDTSSPILSSGYPEADLDRTSGQLQVHLQVEDKPDPEVVRVEVEYGATPAYGQSADSGRGYFRRPTVTMPWLTPNRTYHYRLRLIDPVGNATVTPDYTLATPVETPHRGAAAPAPGKTEAEDFDDGGSGVGYYASTPGNAGKAYRQTDVDIYPAAGGGYYAGNINSGNWLNYTVNAAAAGVFTASFSLASSAAGSLHVEVDGANVSGAVNFSGTGSLSVFQTVQTGRVAIAAGQHVLRVFFDQSSKSSFDWFRLDEVTMNVTPAVAALGPGEKVQLAASASDGGPVGTVAWANSPRAGTILADGVYTAPGAVGEKLVVTITASSTETALKGEAVISVQGPPVAVVVAPGSITLPGGATARFTARVSNTSDSCVTWSASPEGMGVITGAGVYSAPEKVDTQQIVTIRAISHADPSKSGTATVTLLPPASIKVAPQAGTVKAGQTFQFTAAVSNAGRAGVNWSVSPMVGAISRSGLYMAPAKVTTAQTVTIRATSQADRTKFATATVTVSPGP